MSNQDHDAELIQMCLYEASQSRDPDTQVGSVIVTPDRKVIATGFNRFPRGIAYTPERLHNREIKLRLMVHAEVAAICDAARRGAQLEGATLYLCATDCTGMIWGGAPCTGCTTKVIEAGVARVVSLPFKPGPSKWTDDVYFARGLLDEARLEYTEANCAALDHKAKLSFPAQIDQQQRPRIGIQAIGCVTEQMMVQGAQ